MVAPRDQHTEALTYSSWIYRIQLAAARAHDRALTGEGETDPSIGGAREARAQRREIELADAERHALDAGLDRGSIADARAVGQFIGSSRHRIPMGARPQRVAGVEVLCVDLLLADLWHLERMAALDAARQDLVETGVWPYGAEKAAQAGLYERMDIRHARARQMVIVAHITEQEANLLWGAAAQATRAAHAASVAALSDTNLHTQWQSHTFAEVRLRWLSSVRENPDSGVLLWRSLTELPAPAAMIAHAAAARTTHLATDTTSPVAPSGVDVAAESSIAGDRGIDTTVHAALPGKTGTSWEPDHDGPPPPPPERSAGADLDVGWSR